MNTLLLGGICLLFGFVSFLPVSYFFSYKPGVFGLFINTLKFFPPAGVILLFAILIWNECLEGLKGILCGPVVPSIIFFEIIVFISSLGAPEPLLGLSRDVFYLITGPILCLLVVGGVKESMHIRRLVEVMFWTGVVVSCYGIMEFVMNRNPFFEDVFNVENPLYAQFITGLHGARIISSVGHPVILGAYLIMIIPLGFVTVWEYSSWTHRMLKICGVLCMVCALLLTFSRGAWVGFAAGMVVYAGLRTWIMPRRDSLSLGHIVGKLALMVAIVAVFVAMILSFERVSSTLAGRETWQQIRGFKKDPRGVAYGQVADIVSDHPLLGVGTAHYRYLAKRYGDVDDDTPDNGYLRYLAENGILGLGAILVVFVGLFRTLLKQIGKGGNQKALGAGLSPDFIAGLVAGLSGFLVDLITCSALHIPLTRLTFWMLAGLSLAVVKITKNRNI